MSNSQPIYSHAAPKSSRVKVSRQSVERHGGDYRHPESRRVSASRRNKDVPHGVQPEQSNQSKVEAYLNSVQRQQRFAQLRSLNLVDVATPRSREKETNCSREHRRERDNQMLDLDGPLSPQFLALLQTESPGNKSIPEKKSSTWQNHDEGAHSFLCREWVYQKLAHSLEQRHATKTFGVLVLGDAGSGKTVLCEELSAPSTGPSARQQRNLNRRLLAKHFLQCHDENTIRMAEFIRSIAMQILAHSDHNKTNSNTDLDKEKDKSPDLKPTLSPTKQCRAYDCEEKPLLDSEDQKTDEDEIPVKRREKKVQMPEPSPRSKPPNTNPFLNSSDTLEAVYENHENVFLRNATRDSKIYKSRECDSSESDTKNLSATESTHSNNSKVSKIPIASFKYPNKTNLNIDQSPKKILDNKDAKNDTSVDISKEKQEPASAIPTQPSNLEVPVPAKRTQPEELPEYLNVRLPERNGKNTLENNLNLGCDEKIYSCSKEMFKDEIDSPNPWEVQEDELFYGNLETTRPLEDDGERPPPIPSLPVNPRTLIANQYYEKLMADSDIQKCLLPHNLTTRADECFRNGILIPLLELEAPKQSLFILVDSIDETALAGSSDTNVQDSPQKSVNASRNIAELLANNHHMFPPWLLLVCTQRKQSKTMTKMFTGFRKIVIDESIRARDDVQRYIAARALIQPLRSRLAHLAHTSTSQAAEATDSAEGKHPLHSLAIRADGCLLYAAKVLDGVEDGFIALREVKDIPGTLNGLYLWLAQRLFHGRRFNKVRLLLEVLLAAKCGVNEQMLYKCALVADCTMSREEFSRRLLYLAKRSIVTTDTTGCIRIFHSSFARWLLDVKHCTRRYLCKSSHGHAVLAMYYTLEAKRLNALETHNFVYHMTRLEQYLEAAKKNKEEESDYMIPQTLDLHTTMILWILDSGCNIEAAMKKDSESLNAIAEKFAEVSNEVDATEVGNHVDANNRGMQDSEWLDALLQAEVLPQDVKVTRMLHDLTRSCSETKLTVEQVPAEPRVTDGTVPEEYDTIHFATERNDLNIVKYFVQKDPNCLEELDTTGGTPLNTAARHGSVEVLVYLLNCGANVHAKDCDGWSPLRTAARAGHTEVVDELLKHGCDVNCVDDEGRTALRAAAWAGHESTVVRLLEAEANPNICDAAGRSPLTAAAYMGHSSIVTHLFKAGADINARDADGRTPLSVATLCPTGCETIATLLELNADSKIADRDMATPLHVAASEGHTEIVELLLEHEAELEAQDANGRTALWAAAGAGHAQTTKVLLYWGAAVDGVDSSGRTVLTAAAAHGNLEVVRQLLDRGMDEQHRDNSGWTPLHYAAFEGHSNVCEALLEAGAKVDETDNDGKGPLMLAAQEGHTTLCELLIDKWDAPVGQKAHDGKTAFRLAALEGHLETMSLLYVKGADLAALDADSRTVLYALCLHGKLAAASHLITLSRPSHRPDPEGRTPLHVAAWQGHADLVDLLIALGNAHIEERDACGRTALHAAAWRGRTQTLKALIGHGANVNALCGQGATPLGIAAQEGHEDCVMLLLEAGADPMQADHCGRTPISVSRRAGHMHIARILERWQHQKKQSSNPQTADLTPCTSMMANLRLSPSLGQESPVVRRRTHSNSHSERPRNNLSHDSKRNEPICNSKVSRSKKERERLRSHIEEDSNYAYDKDGYASPLYISPSRSPTNEIVEKQNTSAAGTDNYFHRDTHMRIILGRDKKSAQQSENKNKRNGIVTNPAMRLVANVRNGLDSAAANIRRTGVALAASASSNNPAIKTDAFQWRRETPL